MKIIIKYTYFITITHFIDRYIIDITFITSNIITILTYFRT